MEKFKQYFHPFTNQILSINELKSIESAYKQTGSVGTFDDYVKNEYFVKPGKLYPTLERAVSANDTNYKVLELNVKSTKDEDENSDQEELLDEYDNVIAKQSKTPVLERKIEAKVSDIPVLERKINAKVSDIPVLEKNSNLNQEESSDEDEEGIPYLKRKINAKEQKQEVNDSDSSDDDSKIPSLKKKINSNWDDEEKEALETELMLKEANNDNQNDSEEETKYESSDSEEPYVNGNSFDPRKSVNVEKRMFHSAPHEAPSVRFNEDDIPVLRKMPLVSSDAKTKSFSLVSNNSKSFDDSESDEDDSEDDQEEEEKSDSMYSNKRVQMKTVSTKITSNLREDSPFLNHSRITKHAPKATNNNKTIDLNNIDSFISKSSSSSKKEEKTVQKSVAKKSFNDGDESLSYIERLNRDAELEKKQASSHQPKTISSKASKSSSSSNKSFSREQEKLLFKNALKIASKDMREFLISRATDKSDFAEQLKRELKEVTVGYLDSKSGAWKSSNRSASDIQKSFSLLNIEKISQFGQSGTESSNIRFLSAAHTLLEASSNSDHLRISKTIASFSKTPVSIEAKSSQQNIAKVETKEQKIETLYPAKDDDAKAAVAWMEKLYKKTVLNSSKSKSTSDKVSLYDRLNTSDPKDQFPVPWDSVSNQVYFPLEVFWQHMFHKLKTVEERRRVYKNALIFTGEMVMANAKRGNDDEISKFFLLVHTDHWNSLNLRRRIYDHEYQILNNAVSASEPETQIQNKLEKTAAVSFGLSDSIFSKQNRFHRCSIAMKIPDSVKSDFSWVYDGTVPFTQNAFFKKVHQIVSDPSMSKENVHSLHHKIVLALKADNFSSFGTNILLLMKFSFDSYKLLSNWITQTESGVDFGEVDQQFKNEIYNMNVAHLDQLYEIHDKL